MKWFLVAVIVACTTAAELIQADAARKSSEVRRLTPRSITHFFRNLARAHILAVITLLAVSFFAFLGLLAVADLSFAVPATALAIATETILAAVVFRERIHWLRWLGVVLVVSGVFLLGQ